MLTGVSRPHLHIYAHSNELDEVGVISLSGSGVKVEHSSTMDTLFGVRGIALRRVGLRLTTLFLQRKHTFTLFTPSNSHALAAPNSKELLSWLTKIDPTQIPS